MTRSGPGDRTRCVAVAILLFLVAGCTADRIAPPDSLTMRLGGAGSARELRGRPFNQPARNMTNVETRRFGEGAETFNRETTELDGLGPTFNQASCLGCHADGTAPVDASLVDQLTNTGLLLRLSVPGVAADGGPAPEPTYGRQLQTAAVSGATPEGRLEVEWRYVAGAYADGVGYRLRRPEVRAVDLANGAMHPDVMTSPRIAPAMIGLGLLEAIPNATILEAADPDDSDGDGISGRVQYVAVTDPVGLETSRLPDLPIGAVLASRVIGRFGWKGGEPTVAQQTEVALREDMGVEVNTVDEPGPADEMTSPTLGDMVFYNRTIAVPMARDVDRPAVARGAVEFQRIGCASCHTPTIRTGDSDVPALVDQTIHPYTDLLLHDMGPGLADGRPEYEASGSEWRTAPLWGLGHRVGVVGYGAFLHDGRAATPTEAILWHGGEAEAARRRFLALGPADRMALAVFLDSL